MLLQVQLKFYNNNGCVAISDVIMLFCPLPDNWILCRIGLVGKKCGLTVLVLVNAQSILHIVFQLYDVLRFDSTVVINVAYISMCHPQSQTAKFFRILKFRVHEYASGLTSTSRAELFCNCKRR